MTNKIGIEVQVEFPTVAELQRQLAAKWSKVKNGFEGKINVDVDGTSLRSMKAKIQKSLTADVFHVKLDTERAIAGINTLQNEIKELDRRIEKTRDIKIDFKITDMDKSFRELLENNKKVEKAVEEQNKDFKRQGEAIENNVGKMSKYVRLQRQLKDGSVAVTQKWTKNGKMGESETITEHPDGRRDIQNVQDKEKALKEIEAVMKRIHGIEMESIGASGKQLELLNKEKRRQTEQHDVLKDMYTTKYKLYSFSDESLKELKATQRVAKELKEQEVLRKKLTAEERELADVISRVAQLERKKQQLAKDLVTATEAESTALREQYNHHERIQDALKQSHNLAEKMTSEQKEELQNIRTIGALERERLRAKKQQQEEEARLTAEQRQQAAAEKTALAEMKAGLKEVHRLEMQIEQIKTRQQSANRELTQDERNRLQIMESELTAARQLSRETDLQHTFAGNVSEEMREQLRLEGQILQRERDRTSESAKLKGQQDEVSAKLKQHHDITRQIGQLQRDMIFSGMREQGIIEGQISALRDKQREIRQGLEHQNAMTDAMKEEIRQTERLQTEQRQLNTLRQQAREKDRAFNDTGGLIDPQSFAMHTEQAAMAIFEPVRKLDEALVGITKVADGTEDQFRQFAEGAYDAGAALGVTADEYMLAVEKWVTAGKTFAESQDLAEVSLVGSFVGAISPDDMVKYMSVPLSAFAKEGLKAEDVINTMNETANNHAIEMNDLGKAYVRSAGSARDAGVNFDELTGMITGAQEATRKGGERIGTGIKSMAINVSSIFSQMTPANVRKYDFFKGIGVDFADSEGNMKSMTNVMDELAGKWDSMSDGDKGTAKFYLAGKEHSETMVGMIDQWDKVKETMDESELQKGLGKDGSAYIEHAKQADSIKFKLAELKNAWDELMSTLGGGADGVGGVMDVLTNGLTTLNNLVQNDKLMETLKFIFAGMALHAGANVFRRFFDTVLTGFGQIMRQGRNVAGLMGQLGGRGGRNGASGAGGSSTTILPTGAGANTVARTGANGGAGGADGRRTTTPPVIVPRPSTIMGADGRPSNQREIDEANRRQADMDREADTRGQRSTSRMATAGKLAKGVLGFLPLIGDALLILELTGVPVFETIGNGWNKMFGKAEEGTDAFQKSVEKFQKSNGILNGEVKANQEALDKIEESINKKLEIDRDPETKGKQSYLTADEYDSESTQFNDLATSLGHSEIQITMNDTTHIKEQIAALQTALNQLTSEQNIELTTNLTEVAETYTLNEKKYADLKARSEQVKEDLKVNKEGLEEVTEKYGEGSVQVEGYKREIKKLKEEQVELKDEMHETGLVLDDASVAIRHNAKDFLAQGEAVQLSKMSTKEAADVLPVLQNEYANLHTEQSKHAKMQDVLSGKTEVTAEQYAQLVKDTIPAYIGVSQDQMLTDEEVRESMMKTSTKAEESGKTQIKSAEGAMLAVGERAGKESEVQAAIDETKKKTKEGSEQIDVYSGKLEKIPAKVNTSVDVNMDGEVSLWEKFTNWITGGKKSASVTVDVKENRISVPSTGSSFIKPSSLKSVAVGMGGASSASVSTGGSSMGEPARVASVSKAVSTKEKEDTSGRVNSDVWRYWKTEMKIEDVTQTINKLTASINKAAEKEDELIKLYKKQNSALSSESTWQKKLSSQKQSEMSGVLKSLRKYGFKTSGNDITNLDITKGMKGDKASKVDELLGTWRSLGTEMTSISESIANLNETIKTNNEAIKAAQIQKELERLEKTMKKSESVMKLVGNSTSMASTRMSFVEGRDSELGLLETEKAMNVSKASINHLLYDFNRLAKATINYKENGELLEAQLESVGSEIIAQADAIIAYQQSINELEFSRVVNDLNEFNSAIGENSSKIDNNIKNLQEGLLNGTDIGDLQSSALSDIDLNRNNQFEKAAQERINLEKQVQDVMDAFAKKNVERQKGVANAQLNISNQMYKELLTQKKNYDNGKYSSARQVTDNYNDAAGIGKTAIDKNYKFADGIEKIFDKVAQKQEALTKKYETNMAKLTNPDSKEALTNRYISDSMKIQEEYFKSSIEASKKAITELKKQLKDTTLTDEQEAQIKEAINSYEQSVTDSQNNIKDSIAKRFEFEFSLLDEALGKYGEFSNELEYAMEILNSVGGDIGEAYGTLLGQSLTVEKARNAEIAKSLGTLNKQLSLYKEGSFEWELINAQVDSYNNLLKDSNKQLLEMNKNILSNSFDNTMSDMEKKMFGGESLEEYERQKGLWMEGLEREIALEDTYQRLADLETQIHDQKMLHLAKQEKLSKFEMDYLNKQLDVLELQQKLENLNKERTVQTLKQQDDGTWDWAYEADANQVSDTESELRKKQLELEQVQEEARKSYLTELDKILSGAEAGDYETVSEMQKAIDDLTSAFSSIVGEMPEIEDEYLKDLIGAYKEYLKESGEIIDTILNPVTDGTSQYKGLSSEVAKAIKDISGDIGEAFALALLAKMPNFGGSATEKTEDKSISITLEKIEFPNINSADGIKEAILGLPQLALQKSKSK